MGLILGLYDDQKREAIVQERDSTISNRNHFVLAGSGSGKTASYVIPNMIHETECSFVVTDVKGEIFEKTAGIKEKQGYEVRVINFNDMENSDRYNPLDYVEKNVHAGTVANLFVKSKNNPDKKDIWYLSQTSLLKSLILYVRHEFPPERRNMEGILDFIQEFSPKIEEDEDLSPLDEQFLKLPKRHPARRTYELGFYMSEDRTRSSIVLSLATTIGDYVDDEVAHFTSFSDFDLKDIGTRKIALYVIIPEMDDTFEGLVNIFFTQMFSELYKVGKANGTVLPQPVQFILDEFANLGKFSSGFERFLSTCRGYGIGVSVIIQAISQLYDLYGKDRTNSILGVCAVQICLGEIDEPCAEFFSKKLDEATVKDQTGSTSKSKGAKNESSSSSDSYNYHGRKLIRPGEIMTMPKHQSLIIIKGMHPFKARKAMYFEIWKGAEKLFPRSQMDYSNQPTQEMITRFENLEKEYQKKVRSDYTSASTIQEGEGEKDVTEDATAFFFQEDGEESKTEPDNETAFDETATTTEVIKEKDSENSFKDDEEDVDDFFFEEEEDEKK